MILLYKKDKGNEMKKFLYIFFIISIVEMLYSSNIINQADYYLYPYRENGRENFFPYFFIKFKEKHNIKIFIYRDIEKKANIIQKSEKIFKEIESQNKEKLILIFVNYSKKKGKILLSKDLYSIFNKSDVEILENEVLNKFIGRWYMDELSIYTKISGTFFYILEKENLDKTMIEKLKPEIILIDDLFFKITTAKPFSDILNLFYLEPISFVFYFPFVTYFIFVRIIGYYSGLNGFKIMNIIWGLFTIFIAILIYNKMYIILPEYMNIFLMFCGLSIPVYIYLYFIYSEEIQCALYSYFNKITGGFNESIFQKD